MNEIEINLKTKEIKMSKIIDKPVHLGLDGIETEYEDMQELIGVLDPINTEFVEFSLEKRARKLKLIGKDDTDLGFCYQPFPSEFEQAPYSSDMGVKAVEYMMANHVEIRSLMHEILTRAKDGHFSYDLDLNKLDGDYDQQKSTWNNMIKPCLTILKYTISICGNMVKIEWNPLND